MSKRVNAVHYYDKPIKSFMCCGTQRTWDIVKDNFWTEHRPSVTCKRCLQALVKADLEAYKKARQ